MQTIRKLLGGRYIPCHPPRVSAPLGILVAIFFKKLLKIAQRLGALLPDPSSLWRLTAPPSGPRLLSFELHFFIQQVSQFLCFHFLAFGSGSLRLVKS